MQIALYGLPTAGKSYVLNEVRNLEVLSGSELLKKFAPSFQDLTEREKGDIRKRLARELRNRDNFIMDGHYSFGKEVAFTEEDGQLYDAFLYLYVKQDVLIERMRNSIRNKKYLKHDIEWWQNYEVESLRKYCQKANKDFYLIDNPETGFFTDISLVLEFIDCIISGYSCVNYATKIVEQIPVTEQISLVDGDKTFIIEDSSSVLGYKTHLFDGNHYTGFQAWRHHREMIKHLENISNSNKLIENMNLHLNENVFKKIVKPAVFLTTGNYDIWKQFSKKYDMPVFCGIQMCADTKYFVTKFMQNRGAKVTAFGDSMNDYYMLKQADIAYIVRKKDGSVSSSLREKNLEGISVV